MSVLKETQRQCDEEMADILGLSIDTIESLPIDASKVTRITDGDQPEDLATLYANFKYMDLLPFIRSSVRSALRRHEELSKLIAQSRDLRCLDFGAGVGTHTIALIENGAKTSMLDVDGPLRDYAIKRISRRFGINDDRLENAFTHDAILPNNYFDLVICTNVLEHVNDPACEIKRIHASMKAGGLIHLVVSNVVKPSSGHFSSSIKLWNANGVPFVKRAFKPIRPTIWSKR